MLFRSVSQSRYSFDIDIDTNNPLDALNKDEQSALDLTIKELKNTPAPQIIQNYTLDLIRSLGSVAYQYALLTALVALVSNALTALCRSETSLAIVFSASDFAWLA